MEFCYAAFNIASPKHLPIWWHPGSAYPLHKEKEIIHRWQEHAFDLLILNKNDFTRLLKEIIQLINNNYIETELKTLSDFTIKPI